MIEKRNRIIMQENHSITHFLSTLFSSLFLIFLLCFALVIEHYIPVSLFESQTLEDSIIIFLATIEEAIIEDWWIILIFCLIYAVIRNPLVHITQKRIHFIRFFMILMICVLLFFVPSYFTTFAEEEQQDVSYETIDSLRDSNILSRLEILQTNHTLILPNYINVQSQSYNGILCIHRFFDIFSIQIEPEIRFFEQISFDQPDGQLQVIGERLLYSTNNLDIYSINKDLSYSTPYDFSTGESRIMSLIKDISGWIKSVILPHFMLIQNYSSTLQKVNTILLFTSILLLIYIIKLLSPRWNNPVYQYFYDLFFLLIIFPILLLMYKLCFVMFHQILMNLYIEHADYLYSIPAFVLFILWGYVLFYLSIRQKDIVKEEDKLHSI